MKTGLLIYAAQAARKCGTVIYETSLCDHIECTAFFEGQPGNNWKNSYKWQDAYVVYTGECKYSGKGRPGAMRSLMR